MAFALTCVLAATPDGVKLYPTPLAAADALLTGGAQKDVAGVLEVLGPGGKEVLFSGDEVLDKASREAFVAAAKDKLTLFALSPDVVFLMVGPDDWPFPVPIVKGEKGWYWDTAAGKEEVISRRVGRNELTALALCGAFVEAQRDYAALNPAGAGAGVYAQRILSTEGKKDGLYWPAKAGETPSPMGPLAAAAAQEGYSLKPSEAGPKPFHGYLFKILTKQGKDAPGRAKDYIKEGRMSQGFALVAWPVQYGSSGIMTFLVNQAGIVFEKDLGPKTDELAKAIDQFNPDLTWKPAKP
jgi:hypothetical protein